MIKGKRRIYMDAQATTPVDPRVLEAMLPWFTERFGNPASRTHAYGWEAEEAVDEARAVLAKGIGAEPEEIVFTSGATESDNLAVLGVAEAYEPRGRHLVTVATEHWAVLDSCRALEARADGGWRVSVLPVGRDGLLDLDALRRAVTAETVLVSVMQANNEIGVIQPVTEIARIAHEAGALFHCDAAQGFGKESLDVRRMGADLVSLSAHKIYGPKGVGALYVRRSKPRVRLSPQIHGGGHERGLRSGTLNVPGIVGFAKAWELCEAEMSVERIRLTALRDRLHHALLSSLDGVSLNGHPVKRLAGNLNVSFAGVDGEALVTGLTEREGVALSTGSACTSASLEPSYVLKALGIPDGLARASLRFGLGRFTTEAEVDEVADLISAHVLRLRSIAPAPSVSAKEVLA